MKKPPQRALITAGEDGLAAMTFIEIAKVVGGSPAHARVDYRRAIAKLRQKTEALGNMRALATELERHRPVEVDWFGAEEQEREEQVARGRRISAPVSASGLHESGEARPGSLLRRQVPHGGSSRAARMEAAQMSALRQSDSPTRTSTGEVA